MSLGVTTRKRIRSFLQSGPQSTCGCVQRAAISQRAAPVGARTSSSRQHVRVCTTCTPRTSTTKKTNSNCGISMICWTMRISFCGTKGMSTTISQHKCPSGATRHDAEHLGPDNNTTEHCAKRKNQQYQPYTSHCRSRRRAQPTRGLSSWSRPAMMPSISSLATTEGKTA